MEKRTSASNIMRVVSILGIICLLALQWVWWRNAYRAVEVDLLKNTQECLKIATQKAGFNKLEGTSKGVKVVDNSSNPNVLKTAKQIFPAHSATTTAEMEYGIEEILNLTNRPLSAHFIDSLFKKEMKQELGFIPEHSLRIYRLKNEIDSIRKQSYNRIAISNNNDTIYHQFGFKAYTVVVMPSPIGYYLKKGAFILILSLVLVLLIGSVLLIQYRNMLRERKFTDFIIDYTRMITHDLRTPVTGLQMIFAMFLKGSTSTDSKEKYAVEGLSLTKKILLNLDNILYMAKSEQRELPVHKTEVNVGEFMEKTVKLYRERNYNPKIVTIETVYEPVAFNCNMDSSLMENVVCNLLENAIKFTGMDAKITVTCTRKNDVVEWRFRDNGMGMSEEEQSRVFELFERGSSNKQFPGFGIGLHFVQRVVKAHSGKITVQSTVGEGSEFTIRFFS